MEEIVPVALGVLLGALIWGTTSGPHRLLFTLSAVLVSGLTATVLSGEYHETWLYLLLDLAEAALGLAVGMFACRAVLLRRAATRANLPEVASEEAANRVVLPRT